MKPRKEIPKISKKKLAKMGGKVPFSSIEPTPRQVPRKCVVCGEGFTLETRYASHATRKRCGSVCNRKLRAQVSSEIDRGSVEDRFWSKVKKSDGCWEWQGWLVKGYGRFKPHHTAPERYAHRMRWEFANGPIPEGLSILHSCDNPPCVNPAHLRPGTTADNSADMVERGRHGRYNAKKTHCKHGHEFTPENTRVKTGIDAGKRVCKQCHRDMAEKKWNARLSQARADRRSQWGVSRTRQPVRKRNSKRAAKNFERAYGGEQRLEWVKTLPCAVLRVVGACEGETVNAHTVSGGKGRKADAKTIAPLCDKHHRQYDDWKGQMADPSIRELVATAAAETERAWQFISGAAA